MKKQDCSNIYFVTLIFLLITLTHSLTVVEAQTCKPSGKIKAKKPPTARCNIENDDICCIEGRYYDLYNCSPGLNSHRKKAFMTIDSFQKGGDGAGPSKCDKKYHSDDFPVVAVSTGWYGGGSRCMKNITINGNRRSTVAMVVDECDSAMGCDKDHDYLPPCANNIVVASKAVWKALAVPLNDLGELDIYWSDV